MISRRSHLIAGLVLGFPLAAVLADGGRAHAKPAARATVAPGHALAKPKTKATAAGLGASSLSKAVAGSSTANAATSGATADANLKCRGPFFMLSATSTSTQVTAKPWSKPVGARGEGLAPGTCGTQGGEWASTFASAETLRIDGPSVAAPAGDQALLTCALDDDCIAELWVHLETDGTTKQPRLTRKTAAVRLWKAGT